jgi:hypothetical protein
MDILIKKQNSSDQINGLWCYDVNGNVYIKINDNYYSMTIDKNDDIEFYLVNNNAFKQVSNHIKIKYHAIMETSGDTLKKKILDNIENNDDCDNDMDDYYQNYKNIKAFQEEDKYFMPLDDENNENKNNSLDDFIDYDFETCDFKFYQKNSTKSMKMLDIGLETPSIYDTYVRDHTQYVVLSMIFDGDNYYRISLFQENNNNLISLNIVGSKIRTYYLEYNINSDSEIDLIPVEILKK